MIPTTYLQLTDIDSRYNIYTVQNRSLFIKYSRERSLCKRHQDRTVTTFDGWTFVMQTTPYGGDLKRTNKRYQDRTVATSDGSLYKRHRTVATSDGWMDIRYANDTVRWRPQTNEQTISRPYGGDV